MFMLLLMSLCTLPPIGEGTLILRIDGLASDEGQLMVALYDRPEAWLTDTGRVREYIVPLEPGQLGVEVPVEALPYGSYAVAVYHDANGNRELDTNFFGIPVEGYAFSNNPHLKWRRPRFEEARFEHAEDGQEARLQLHRW